MDKPTLENIERRILDFTELMREAIDPEHTQLIKQLKLDMQNLSDTAKYVDTGIAEKMLNSAIAEYKQLYHKGRYREVSAAMFHNVIDIRATVYDKIIERDFFHGKDVPFEALELCNRLGFPIDDETFASEKIKNERKNNDR